MSLSAHLAAIALVAVSVLPVCACSAAPDDDSATTAALASQDTSGTSLDAIASQDAGPRSSAGDAEQVDVTPQDTASDTVDSASAGRYPIVLAHGFFGFDKFAGSKFVTYFYKVPEALAAAGEGDVFTPAVDPFNSSDVRGKQLLAHIEAILAKTGRAKVHVIGHSQGGLDARVAAWLKPELFASVTTYATPNNGTPVADWAMKLLANDNLQKLLDALAKLIGAPLYDKLGAKSSVVAGIQTFTQPGIKAFNEAYPDRPSVQYYSVTGRTDLHLAPISCKPDLSLPFITKHALVGDPVDPLFAIQEAMLDGGLGAPFPNDGMVRVKDAKHGVFLGCVPADHMDQVGHLLGDKPGLLNPWDHRAFFVELVAFLRSKEP